MKKTKITIKDLATELGIGIATVSRALNDSGSVKAETKMQVFEACKRLNYKPNLAAKALVKNKTTNTIGYILPSLRYSRLDEQIKTLQKKLTVKDYDLQICLGSENFEQIFKLVDSMLSRAFDGIIVTLPLTKTKQEIDLNIELIEHLQRSNTPFVFSGQINADKIQKDFSQFDYNWLDCGKEVTNHLFDIGRKRIIFISDIEDDVRKTGYMTAMLENNQVPSADMTFVIEHKLKAMDKNFDQILAQKPDAIFANSDRMAYFVIKLLHQRKIRIPDDIAVAGAGNELYSDVFMPPLTTYDPNRDALSRHLADEIINRIENPNSQTQRTFVNGSLIIRQSTTG